MTEHKLRQDVECAIEWEPSVDAGNVGVSVSAGVVTLRGEVRSYAQKAAAERVALSVSGVQAVANDLVVRLVSDHERSDTDIAQAALSALAWNSVVPPNRVTVTVANGWLTLNGTLDWRYQKDAAGFAVRYLLGVRGVTNTITVKPRVEAADLKAKIEAAFKRSAEIDGKNVTVVAMGDTVVLNGHVRSWAERREAERTAWAAPGVSHVDDRITITP